MQIKQIVPLLFSVLITVVFTCREGRGERSATNQSSAVATRKHATTPVVAPKPHRGKAILGVGLGEFIFIHGGEFTMGQNAGEHENQRPEHVVKLASFYVGRTPVTNTQFIRFLNETDVKRDQYLYSQIRYAVPSVTFTDGRWSVAEGTESDAACSERWELAEKYCKWLSANSGRKCRLPTEAEWEYVCRGKQGRKFPWGNKANDINNRVWEWRTWRPDKPHRIPVGSFPKGATPEGVCDLVGYMDEMCSDWYDPEYYSKSPRMNPRGPSGPEHIRGDSKARVTRGGLEHRYSTTGPLGFFRSSSYFGVLPLVYLPRGWSRNSFTPRPKSVMQKNPDTVYGRLGFRIVVESGDL